MGVHREFADGEVVSGTRYRVISLIGSGGMGSVYEVEHVELGKRFVLKALLRGLSNRNDLVHRLRNEWRALGRLEHPNIVSVTDAGVTTTNVPYYVMERLHGETLGARLRRERRLPLADALSIAADVLDGLWAAHRIDIVHRDVKPPNIFLVNGRPPKLLDFGIAKMLDPKASQITGRGIAIGTPRYMAPEQASGETVDARTDLYALGLILYEMIAGVGPFESSRDSNELLLAHLAQAAPALSSLAPDIPAELDQWVARLLAKKPSDRPSDAATVSAALRALRPRGAARAPSVEERTSTGGPFDTLEAALTVPIGKRAGARHGETSTRTGVAEARGTPPIPADTLVDPPRADGTDPSPRTATVTFDLVLPEPPAASGTEAPTRTAAPSLPQIETPPPVAGGSVPPLPSRRSPRRATRTALATAGVLGVVVAAGVITSVTLRSSPKRTSPVLAREPEPPADRAAPGASSVTPPSAAVPAAAPAVPAEEPVAPAFPETAPVANPATPPAVPLAARDASNAKLLSRSRPGLAKTRGTPPEAALVVERRALVVKRAPHVTEVPPAASPSEPLPPTPAPSPDGLPSSGL